MLSKKQIDAAEEFVDSMSIDEEFVKTSIGATIQEIIITAVKMNNPGSLVFPTKESEEVWEYMANYAYNLWTDSIKEESYEQGRADKTFEDMTKDI